MDKGCSLGNHLLFSKLNGRGCHRVAGEGIRAITVKDLLEDYQ